MHLSPILFSVLLLTTVLTTSVNPAHAALTATTANTIQGTAPYIMVNNVEATDLSSLLSIEIGGTVYISNEIGDMKKYDTGGTWIDAGSLTSPITLNSKNDTFGSVLTVLPADTTDYLLNDPVVKSKLTLKDNDGDAGFVLSGNFKGEWTDRYGDSIGTNLNDKPNGCSGPYTLILQTQNSPTVTTQYGDR